MKPIQQRFIAWYFIADFVAAFIAWFFLYLFRKFVVEDLPFNFFLPFKDNNFYVGLSIVPEIWLALHYFSGAYTDVFRKSRVQELVRTFLVAIVGSLIIFFSLLLDDVISKYSDYYLTFLVLFSTQFIFTFLGRFFVLHQSKLILIQKKFGFNTLLIGSPKKVNELLHTLTQKVVKRASTFIFKGWINSSSESPSTVVLPCLGDATQIQASINKYDIKEVIIAIETSAHQELNYYLNILAGNDVYIRIVPDMYDILSRGVKMNHVVGEAFIEIPPSLLNEWEVISKRWFDILASSFALLVTAPFLFFIALRIKFSSTGPIFYTQERIGQFGKPFHIIKFRSMYVNAEEQEPKLTTDEDPRITPIGKWIRKYRIDEVPQFWNVIKGDMSIVGPRAERQFFAEKIIVAAPHYKLVWKVKPGITSLGMVKYGYASTVEEMLQRLKYDIIYIENMNLLLDLKILLYTISTVIYGRGK